MNQRADIIVPREKDNSRLIKGTTDPDVPDRIAVDFQHLDTLIGSLCHVADLNSDREYREHLKSELKIRCREWLRDQYRAVGYYDTSSNSLELVPKQ